MGTPRSFSMRQRRALYLAAGGQCEGCGTELEKGWHADHVIPHSMGGDTTIENGQALCPNCNLKKSDNIHNMRFKSDIFGPPPHPAPYDWQERAIREFDRTSGNFLADVTPGAGKTAFAAYLFRHGFEERWDQIMVITNSQARREGWQSALQQFGVQVMENWGGRDTSPTLKGYHGCVATYHILPYGQVDLNALSQKERTLVVFDEIHHLGDEQSWAEAARYAFDHECVQPVGLTGTPFRSDDKQIPFVDYERTEDGQFKSQGDVGYTYGDALSDEVLRPVHFFKYDGDMTWRDSNGDVQEASFSDKIPQRHMGGRLRTAVSEKEYLFEQIEEANHRLTEIRKDTPCAAGFIVARNQNHAEKIAGWMTKDDRLGTPALIVSDDSRATSTIDNFKTSNRRWAIAVEKISEGVNIKRLRVGVYASNKTAPLFLHQVVGRVLRGSEGQAWFWFPDDPRIVEELNKIEEMRDHVIENREDGPGGPGPGPESESEYESIEAERKDGEVFGPLFDQIPYMTEERLADLPESVKDAYIQYSLSQGAPAPSSNVGGDGEPDKSRWDREQELRSDLIHEKVVKAAKYRYRDLFIRGGEDKGKAISLTHSDANEAVGIKGNDTATVEELERKLEVLKEWIAQPHE